MDLLKELVKQRLSAAADEVFELFLKSLEEYVELVRSQNQNVLQMADIQPESGESQESQEQQGCNPTLELALSFPLQIKREPAEPKEPWSHQEEQQLQKEAFPSSTVQMNNTVKAGPAADSVLLDGPHVKPPEQQQWSSSMKQEPKEAESTKSPFPDDEANYSLLPKIESDQLSCEEPMEMENDKDDGGGSEAAQQSASEETANSSETEDSEDEWKKTKQTHSKVVNVVEPKPAREDSSTREKTNPTHTEIEKDVRPEPACNSALTRDPVSEDQTSDSSDAETEDSNRHQKKRSAVETKPLPDAAASSKWHSGKKHGRKSSERRSAKQSLPCPQCGKEFIYRSSLCKHLKNHSVPKTSKHKGKTNIVCSVSDKTFTEQVHLDLHTRTHKVKTDIHMETSGQDKVGGSGGDV
ncbi:protein IWS1 homolog isoform X2 [Melanotaenia boesemani]|uniref:protein IWS1 homolog isoform X2 n=1 Tax=Melanotaenia boesemani TaxID=1250792 RepID=UPI001C041096|nr:protein IWS1 homolog isoform X2 [Melanotaenia boesemani]